MRGGTVDLCTVKSHLKELLETLALILIGVEETLTMKSREQQRFEQGNIVSMKVYE